MQPARNRARIQNDIARIQPGGGTEIFRALDAAYQDLSVDAGAQEARDPAHRRAGADAAASAISCRRWSAEAITVTTVGLGDGVDEQLLRMIADVGGGRFHKVHGPATACRGSSRARPRWSRRKRRSRSGSRCAGRGAGGLPQRHRHRLRAAPPRLRRDEDEAAARAGDPRRANAASRSSRAGASASAGRSRGRAT